MNACCQTCGKEWSVTYTGKKPRFCSKSCRKDVQLDRGLRFHLKYHMEYIQKWKAGLINGMKGSGAISNQIREYLFNKYDSKCSNCGWSKSNPYTNKIPLEVEHLDGNYRNNEEGNLTLLCPNCHSLTATFRALNKGKGRPRK